MPARSENRIFRLAPALLICFISILWTGTLRADHFSGASITYECNGGNMYTVYLDLYIECGNTPITAQSLDFRNDCGVQFVVNPTQILVEEVSQICDNSIVNSTCNGGTLDGFEHYRFETTLFLSPCDDWTISWDICCRNTTQNVFSTPGTYVEATLDNTGGLCDDSPVFTDSGIPYVCLGNDIVYSLGASDPNAHAMQFALIDARFSADPDIVPPLVSAVNYFPGFTGADPIPGITIDPATGQLSFTPGVQGNYVVVIEATTFDANGDLIGTVMRDLMFVVVVCDGDPPSTDGLTNATGGAMITGPNSLEVCDGQQFCVDIVFTDPDAGNVISVVSDAIDLLPGATVQSNGTSPHTVTLCWTPDVSILPVNIYLHANDGQCPIMNVASTSFLISEAPPLPVIPDAGNDGNIGACSTGPAIDLFNILGGNPDAGGFWTDPDGAAHNGNFVPGTDPFGTYTYQVGSACEFDQALVTVTEDAGNAGEDAAITVCSNLPVDLFQALGGTPMAGGTWSGPGGGMNGTFDPAIHGAGDYIYTLIGGPCPGASATVTVSVNDVHAGADAVVDLCSTSPPTALFPLLGAGAQAGGVWSGPSAINGTYDPLIHAPGDYTYTVFGDPQCGDASATVTVNEHLAPNAGMNGNLTICANADPEDLFTILNGTPMTGGEWAGPAGVFDGIYDPAVHAPGNYSYTITGQLPCANATSFVIVAETPAASAGSDAVVDVCVTDAPVDLFDQLGANAQAGGTWSGPSAINGMYDPAVHQPGDYTYTVNGAGSCGDDQAIVQVNEFSPGDAGTGTTIDLCGNAAPVDLFSLLGGTPDNGGMWTGPDQINGTFDPAVHTPGDYVYSFGASGSCAGSSATVTVNVAPAPVAGNDVSITLCANEQPVDLFPSLGPDAQSGGSWSGPDAINGFFDPSIHGEGVYTYSIAGSNGCADASANVTVTVNDPADAGNDVAISLCGDADPIDLFTILNGTPQPGGTWNGPSALAGGIFDPALHAEGNYIYSIASSAPCSDASATVSITVETPVSAGTGGPITVCDAGGTIDLFDQLGGAPQPGGSWNGPSAINGIFDPAQHLPGDYVYSIAGGAVCGSSSATLSVTVTGTPDAGEDAVISVCSNDAPIALFAQLGGTPDNGGTWSGPAGDMDGNFDPSIHPDGEYTYTITAQQPCVGDAATVTVHVDPAPDAGVGGNISVCESGGSVGLFEQLGGSPQTGGTWAGPGGNMDGIFDPAIDLPGSYTYSIAGAGACASAEAQLNISITGSPDAGDDVQITLCSTSGTIDLFDQLGGTPQPGGSWSGPFPDLNGEFDPANYPSGDYTYSITAEAPCVPDQAVVSIVVEEAPFAGTSSSITICAGAGTLDLFDQLGGAQSGGTWSGPQGAFDGSFDPATDPAGEYTYSIVGDACPTATAMLTIAIDAGVSAGEDAAVQVCSSDAPFDLSSMLGGTPDPEGSWIGPGGFNIPAQLDPASAENGEYIYTVSGDGDCPADQATLTLSIDQAPQAGTSGVLELCSDEGQVSLFDGLNGTVDLGGSWTDPTGSSFASVIDPAAAIAGTYTYTVTNGTCPPATSMVNVLIFDAPDAGGDAAIAICSSDDPVSLFDLLEGDPDQGGTWTGPEGPAGAQFSPSIDPPGTYNYVVNGEGACGSVQATVTIEVSQPANAGGDGSIEICSNEAAIDLSAQLGGMPDAGGQWYSPSGDPIGNVLQPGLEAGGTYHYVSVPEAPCPSDTASVAVIVLPVPSPSIVATESDACTPVEVTISHDYDGEANVTWIIGNGAFFQDTNKVITVFDQAGTYDVTLIIDALNGCGANTINAVDLISVAEKPIAAFDALPPVISTQSPLGYFHNRSEGATDFLWQIENSTYTSEHVSHTFPGALGDEYEVCLIAYASPQCADTVCQKIVVADGLSVFVPNAFSANDDGINDGFGPVLDGIDPERYHFDVFDRWGAIIFSTRDPNKRWDGLSTSGQEVPEGVYVWKLHLKDGYSGERLETTGHVTLLR